MGFQKKEAANSKNSQAITKGKQGFEADNDSDSDFEGDSVEEMIVQRTPQNKTPKGKDSQCMSVKKVSFGISGKKTPGKTQQKNNSIIAKKQSTPGSVRKTTLQEFKGMKGYKGVQKKQLEDDDDFEEDDDLEMKDIDMDEEEEEDSEDDEEEEDSEDDDEEEEDSEDDDEEEEDSEDDDEEKEEQKQAQNQNKSFSKQQKKNANTPIKNIDKSKETLTPKAKSPMNEIKENSDDKRKRDLCSLFVGDLNRDVTEDELKALSPDIESVHMPKQFNYKPNRIAFLRFSSEAKAEANYETLQNKTIRGKPFRIDFVGDKLKKCLACRELYILEIPPDATVADVAIHFPKAFLVSFNRSPVPRCAMVQFQKNADAAEAFKLKEIEIAGQKLRILYLSTVLEEEKKLQNNEKDVKETSTSKAPKDEVKEKSNNKRSQDEEDDDDSELDMDEEEEEDHSDEEEEQKPTQNQNKSSFKQQKSNARTPKKNIDKSKETLTPKGSQDEEKDDDSELDMDEEEEDHSDEEEEQKPTQNQNKSNFKQQKNNARTPKRNIEKRKEILTPKGDRYLCSLFVGNLPKDVTVDELKALSPDIESVHIRLYKKEMIAHLIFSSEAKAETNYKALQNQTIRGVPFPVGFVGDTKKNKKKTEPFWCLKGSYNLRQLFIDGLPLDATIADVGIHFPKAYQVTLNDSPVFRSVAIYFETEEDAAEAINLKVIEVKGQKLELSYYRSGLGLKKWKRDKDLCLLFVGNLPKDVTVNELKALSPDIEYVDMSARPCKRGMIAFLKFSSEMVAVANYETLQNQTIRGEPFCIGFVGERSKNEPLFSSSRYNLSEIFIKGLPLDTTIADVGIHFPKAYDVSFNDWPVFRNAIIHFKTEEDAAESFKLKAIEINGQKRLLWYNKSKSGSTKSNKLQNNEKDVKETSTSKDEVKEKSNNKRKSGKNKNNAGQSPSKKMKF